MRPDLRGGLGINVSQFLIFKNYLYNFCSSYPWIRIRFRIETNADPQGLQHLFIYFLSTGTIGKSIGLFLLRVIP